MKLLQIEPLIESLPKGVMLRKTLALALRILTGVVIFSGLFVVLGLIGQTIDVLGHDPALSLGSLISMVLVIAAIVVAVKILLFRAKHILIDNEVKYPLINLSALLLRTAGDLLALFYSAAGLIAGILVWFGGEFPIVSNLWLIFVSPSVPAVFLGLGIILTSILQAVLGLLFFYLLAELLLLLRNIALK